MPKQTKKQRETSDVEFLKYTTAGRPMATPPSWLRNSFQDHTENLGQYANTAPTGNYRPFQPYNLNYSSTSLDDDFPPRSIQTVGLRPGGNAAPSAKNDIQPTTQPSGIPVSPSNNLMEKWQAFIQSSGTYEDIFKQINDINTRYSSNEGLLNQLKNNNTSADTAQKIRDIEKEQDQLRTQLSELNIRRKDMESLKDQIDMQLQSSEQTMADIYAQMEEISTAYTSNEGLLNQLKNHNAPAETIRELEQKRELLGKQLQELNNRREQITDNVNNIISFRNLLYPEAPDQLENQEDQDAVVSKDQPDQPNLFAGDQNDNISIMNNAQEESIQDKIDRILESPLTIEDASLMDSLSYIDGYLNEISEITSMGKTLRGHLGNIAKYYSVIRDLNNKRREFSKLKKEYEQQKEDIFAQISSITKQMDSKYNEILSYLSTSGGDNTVANEYKHHVQYLTNQWNMLFNEYQDLGNQLDGKLPPNIPTYEKMDTFAVNHALTDGEFNNTLTVINEITNYFADNPEEYQQFIEQSQLEETIDIDQIVSDLFELHEAISDNFILGNDKIIDIIVRLLNPIPLSYGLTDFNDPYAIAHVAERELLAGLSTLSSVYQINGKQDADINVVWLLSETGDKARSILIDQDPKNNKVTIIDPTGEEREVYAFEVSYIPNYNENVASYMREFFDKEYHHTKWHEIPDLILKGGSGKLLDSVLGLASLIVELPGGDMSDFRNLMSIYKLDVSQEANQAGKFAGQVYEITSDAIPITTGILIDQYLPGSSVLLTIGGSYTEGMRMMEGQENVPRKALAYASTVGLIDGLTGKYATDIIKKGVEEVIKKIGVKALDKFTSYIVEYCMAKGVDEIGELIGHGFAGLDSRQEKSEIQVAGSVLAFIMQSIGEGDLDMISFMEHKMNEKNPWTEDDLTFVISKMTGQTRNQQTLDPATLIPYTTPENYNTVEAFAQMAADDTIQIASDGNLVGSNFVLAPSSMGKGMQDALAASDIPYTDIASLSASESDSALDTIQIGDTVKNAHSDTLDPVGENDNQVYFYNKYQNLVGIPQTVFSTIETSGFNLFALDDGRLAITSGNEIVGFVYPDSE